MSASMIASPIAPPIASSRIPPPRTTSPPQLEAAPAVPAGDSMRDPDRPPDCGGRCGGGCVLHAVGLPSSRRVAPPRAAPPRAMQPRGTRDEDAGGVISPGARNSSDRAGEAETPCCNGRIGPVCDAPPASSTRGDKIDTNHRIACQHPALRGNPSRIRRPRQGCTAGRRHARVPWSRIVQVHNRVTVRARSPTGSRPTGPLFSVELKPRCTVACP
jgi:hypothetical protein